MTNAQILWQRTKDVILVALLIVSVRQHTQLEVYTPAVVVDPAHPVHPIVPPKPTTLANLRVIALFDASGAMMPGQLDVLNSPDIRAYLTAHCTKDGGFSAWRFWDQGIDASRESASWQATLASAKADPLPIPKLVIFDGTTLVKSMPIPSDIAAATAVLTTYGGK